MYHRHFLLREEPFGVSPDGRFFLETEQHREAVASLYYGIHQRRGFGLLVGGPGLGKTSVLVQLLNRLEGEAVTAYLPHPYFDKSTVLESILAALGLEATQSLAQNHRIFYEFLIKTQRSGKTCVVVVDEAQNLSRDTFEAVRMLSNFETPSEKLVQFVLSGQPTLLETLSRADLEQIRQRINVTARLLPLEQSSVLRYMEHRLTIAGASISLFSPEALQAIAAASGGVPRNVNTICFSALTLAYALGHPQVGLAEVTEVLQDFDLTPAPAPASLPSDAAEVAAETAPSPGLEQLTDRSIRPAVIAAGVLLLAAGSFWLRNICELFLI